MKGNLLANCNCLKLTVAAKTKQSKLMQKQTATEQNNQQQNQSFILKNSGNFNRLTSKRYSGNLTVLYQSFFVHWKLKFMTTLFIFLSSKNMSQVRSFPHFDHAQYLSLHTFTSQVSIPPSLRLSLSVIFAGFLLGSTSHMPPTG